jgi:hypothetical protein
LPALRCVGANADTASASEYTVPTRGRSRPARNLCSTATRPARSIENLTADQVEHHVDRADVFKLILLQIHELVDP